MAVQPERFRCRLIVFFRLRQFSRRRIFLQDITVMFGPYLLVHLLLEVEAGIYIDLARVLRSGAGK